MVLVMRGKFSFLFFVSVMLFSGLGFGQSQSYYWQQEVEYEMKIEFLAEKHQFTGKQKLKYTNNSPNDLKKVYYHLYYNAFQPGSMMDIRSRTISDPDSRVKNRIYELKEAEQGWHKILSLKCNGKPVSYTVDGTILEVVLNNEIRSGKSAVFEMEFQSQVPLQIRRTGRNSAEGVEYSMSQWYPKMVEYDADGWHTNPYIGREFYGVWGSFDVEIAIDSAYVLGGTGILQNPEEIGHGYLNDLAELKRPEGGKLYWHFKAEKVHDFAWSADKDFKHVVNSLKDGTDIHYFYQTDTFVGNWDTLRYQTEQIFEILNTNFGKYPYKQFSFIQAGDGGMEYPMCTFVVGHKNYNSFRSTCVHELIHSWYYGVLGTNESKFAWMDEGFTVFAQHYVLNQLSSKPKKNFTGRVMSVYHRILNGGVEEPLCTHADHYNTNIAYAAVYYKGALFLSQLKYIVGDDVFYEILRDYYKQWGFKHPRPVDFKTIAENLSGLELDWYFENWIGTTKTIDYGVASIVSDIDSSEITLFNKGEMPMPVEVEIMYADSTLEKYYIPLRLMRGTIDDPNVFLLSDWPWTYPYYSFKVANGGSRILKVSVDPEAQTADVNRRNNELPKDDEVCKGHKIQEAEPE